MFYPVESLKRGGRFYFCWVADAWPQRFEAINNRQILSQDIRRICQDLQEVICQESGRPSKRFSLRLTSQLIHGLVLLYHRKVNVLIGDLCMIEAHAMHRINKRGGQIVIHDTRARQIPRLVIEEVGDEEQVEELLQRTVNIVANVEDITLREPTLPDNRPLDDGFGEMHLELPVISDRTIELMLGPDRSGAQQSVIDPWGLSPDRLIDQLRVNQSAHIERPSDQDMSLFNKTTGAELHAPGDVDKEIPDIQLPDLPDPQEVQREELEAITLEDIPIEELIINQHSRKRKRVIMKEDACCKLTNAYLRSRIDDNKVELRCQTATLDRIKVGFSAREMLHHPTCTGPNRKHYLGYKICKLYLKRLLRSERHVIDIPEIPMRQKQQKDSGMIVEEIEAPMLAPVIEAPHLISREEEIPTLDTMCVDIPRPNVSGLEPNVSGLEPIVSGLEPNVSGLGANVTSVEPNVREIQDISLMPTQKILEVKAPEIPSLPKRRRTAGTSGGNLMLDSENKENEPPIGEISQLSAMLHKAGISDIDEQETEVVAPRGRPSQNSETPLGSLDRTRVSLGDTDSTTESQRMIRKQWGTFNTMIRLYQLKANGCDPMTVSKLIEGGPAFPGHGRLTIAKCFSSLLKLKQERFIRIEKDPVTLEIVNMDLGPRFDRA